MEKKTLIWTLLPATRIWEIGHPIQAALPAERSPSLRLFHPKQELLPQHPLRCRQRWAGAGGLLCGLTVFPGMCTVVEMGRDFQTHGLKWHDETFTGEGRGGRDVPKPSEQKFHKWISLSLNLLFIFLSMMWIRGQGALSITRFKKSGELMKFIALQPFKYF